MKPVDQTTFGWEGNCFSACVASILELPLERVPYFMGPSTDGKGWWDRFCYWCDDNRITPRYDGNHMHVPGGFSILTGRSPRHPKRFHAVVAYYGIVMHDPHPSRIGVRSVLDFITVTWL
jgi:hypothetical protein